MRILAAILLLSVVNIPPAAAEESPLRQTIVLVPAVQHGHSAMWKTGAILTVTSVGVSLLGAALTIEGMGNPFENGSGGNAGMFISGLVMSAIGDGGLFIAGPIVWSLGTRRDPEEAR